MAEAQYIVLDHMKIIHQHYSFFRKASTPRRVLEVSKEETALQPKFLSESLESGRQSENRMANHHASFSQLDWLVNMDIYVILTTD